MRLDFLSAPTLKFSHEVHCLEPPPALAHLGTPEPGQHPLRMGPDAYGRSEQPWVGGGQYQQSTDGDGNGHHRCCSVTSRAPIEQWSNPALWFGSTHHARERCRSHRPPAARPASAAKNRVSDFCGRVHGPTSALAWLQPFRWRPGCLV